MPKGDWKPELVYVEICWDEVWLEVICLTNLEIAGSPRNIFRYSPINENVRGRALDGTIGSNVDIPIKLRILTFMIGVSPIRLSGAGPRETSQTDS